MKAARGHTVRWLALVAGTGVVLALAWAWNLRQQRSAESSTAAWAPPVAPLPGRPNGLEIASDTVTAMGLQATPVVPAPHHSPLRLTGSLSIDPSRLAHIHVRFPGEVVSLGSYRSDHASGAAIPEESRPLRVGDTVEHGQLLAVVWSREIGDKKSDLIDALSQYYLDRRILDRLRALPPGTVPQRSIEEAERSLEAATIAVARSERTLRSWNLDEDDLEQIRAEARRIHESNEAPDTEQARRWAEVDVVSPLSGIVLEKNIVPGDIVDTQLDLFKVADLSRLRVVANVYEDDLPKLERLPPSDRKWTIRLKSDPEVPEIEGEFDLIGFLVEARQHTAVVTGWLDNPNGQFRVGQFITATIELTVPMGVVMVPETAVVEEGNESYVFVALDTALTRVMRRRVAVRRRSETGFLLAANPTATEREQGCEAMNLDEMVLVTGTVELSGAWHSLAIQSAPRSPAR